jgi:hypothetical protein
MIFLYGLFKVVSKTDAVNLLSGRNLLFYQKANEGIYRGYGMASLTLLQLQMARKSKRQETVTYLSSVSFIIGCSLPP